MQLKRTTAIQLQLQCWLANCKLAQICFNSPTTKNKEYVRKRWNFKSSRFSVSEFIRKLAFSNSSIWAAHLRAENVINREIDEVANLWQILHEEKQMCDQIKCYSKFEFLFTVVAPCLSSGWRFKNFGQWCWKGFSSVFKIFVLIIHFLNVTISAIYCNLLR